MATDREAFVAGERPDDVAIYVADGVLENADALADRAEATGEGHLLVIPGERGRSAFGAAVGTDPMSFARAAGDRSGRVERDLSGATCPDDGAGGDHAVETLFAFAAEQNDAVGGRYAEGDVIHAYVRCSCGTRYSDRWVVED